jgi:hypothetical protein
MTIAMIVMMMGGMILGGIWAFLRRKRHRRRLTKPAGASRGPRIRRLSGDHGGRFFSGAHRSGATVCADFPRGRVRVRAPTCQRLLI